MDPISSQQSKLIKRLALKKYRKSEGAFIVEGKKMVLEALESDGFTVTQVWSENQHQALFDAYRDVAISYHSPKEIARCSLLSTSPGVLAKVRIPEFKTTQTKGWEVVLQGVRDPGNLGTILRIADWFGVEKVWCTQDCVDCYNPKVVQASMGSIFRVTPIYEEAVAIAAHLNQSKKPVFTAAMQGEHYGEVSYPGAGVLVMGSESHGVDETQLPPGFQRVTIPKKGGAESLNVAVAFGILAAKILA